MTDDSSNLDLIEKVVETGKAIVKKVDTNGDGVISFDELKAIPSGLKEYSLLFLLFGINIGQLIYNYSIQDIVNGSDVVNSLITLLLSFAYLIFGGYIKKGYQTLVENIKSGYEKVIKNKDNNNEGLKNEITNLTKLNNEKDSRIQFLEWQLNQLGN